MLHLIWVQLKSIVFLIFGAALFSFSAKAQTPPSKAPKVITIGADPWCPYNCVPESENPGYAIEIAELAFKNNGETVGYQLINWARAIKQAQTQKLDAIVGASKNDAPNFIFPNEPIGVSGTCFYTSKKSTWQYESLKSLDNVQIGLVHQYAYIDELDKYFNDPQNTSRISIVTGIDGVERNFQKILLGRIDTTVTDDSVGQYLINKFDLKDKIKESGCTDSDLVYIAFAPNNKESQARARLIDSTIIAMRKSGELTTLLAKYGLTDWDDKNKKLKQ